MFGSTSFERGRRSLTHPVYSWAWKYVFRLSARLPDRCALDVTVDQGAS